MVIANKSRVAHILFGLYVLLLTAAAEAQEGRQPGCYRELYQFDQLIKRIIVNRAPEGIRIIDQASITDPRYIGRGWAKYSYTSIEKEFSSTSSYSTRYYINIHYLYNENTGAITQVKIINTYDQGCKGELVPIGGSISAPAPLTNATVIVYGQWVYLDVYTDGVYTGRTDSWYEITDVVVTWTTSVARQKQ